MEAELRSRSGLTPAAAQEGATATTSALPFNDQARGEAEERQRQAYRDKHRAAADDGDEDWVEVPGKQPEVEEGEGEKEPVVGEYKESYDALPEPAEEPTPRARAPDDTGGEKMCRICFETSEDDESGRLFSPCNCRGSFFKCDQCGYEYKLNRTKIAGLAQNRIALMSITVVFFTLLVFVSGFAATWMIQTVEDRSARMSGSMFEDLFVPDSIIVGETVREAVNFFGKRVEGWQGDGRLEYGADDSNPFAGWFSTTPFSKPTFFSRAVAHMIKGFSFLGIISFFQTFFVSSFMGPFGLRGSIIRMFRPNRRNGDNQMSATQLVIVAVVVFGIWKAVKQVYSFVHWGSRKLLRRLEGFVLDV